MLIRSRTEHLHITIEYKFSKNIMRTRQEILDRIKYYEDKLHQLFIDEKSDTLEWKMTNEKVMLLQWVLKVDIYRDDAF